MSPIRKFLEAVRLIRALPSTLETMQLALARIESRQLTLIDSSDLGAHEFRVFSQFGEDGILQFLLRKLPHISRTFVEFGVSDYQESNTRFLLQNNNWTGLVIDGSVENVNFIKRQPYYWRHNLKAECAFIDRDNINSLLRSAGMSGKIGILSVDIDGNDYWVWQAIDCIDPAIVVCEYNSLFGWRRKLTVPYAAAFRRADAHYSGIYYGASVAALADLGAKKGYVLAGSNSAGNNLFFVRRDLAGGLRALTAQEAHVEAGFCEARDRDGTLLHLSRQQMLELIGDLPLHDLDTGASGKVRDLCAAE